MIACLSCSAEITNGLALCELCRAKASKDLEFLPIYYRNLARWRPGRAGSGPGPGSRVLYDGEPRSPDSTGDRILDHLAEVDTALTTWARALLDDRPEPPRPFTLTDAVLVGDLPEELVDELTMNPAKAADLLCQALADHLVSISTIDWCGEFVRDLSDHEETLRGLTEAYVPGWYAGSCKSCESRTYVVPGLTWVTCRVCGTTTYARDHLERVLDEARGWVARPKDIAATLVALLDSEQSTQLLLDRIYQWQSRGRLIPIRRLDAEGDPIGPKRYRLGDVLDVLLSEGATRLKRDSSTPPLVSG